MGWVLENWEMLLAVVTGAITLFGMIAELTPWTWDNRAMGAIRAVWAKIPVFTTDPTKMGWNNPHR